VPVIQSAKSFLKICEICDPTSSKSHAINYKK
jgi:hypothetical protein